MIAFIRALAVYIANSCPNNSYSIFLVKHKAIFVPICISSRSLDISIWLASVDLIFVFALLYYTYSLGFTCYLKIPPNWVLFSFIRGHSEYYFFNCVRRQESACWPRLVVHEFRLNCARIPHENAHGGRGRCARPPCSFLLNYRNLLGYCSALSHRVAFNLDCIGLINNPVTDCIGHGRVI